MRPGTTTFMLALLCGSAAVTAQDYQAMAQAMEKAQDDASKPGDEKLSCEQLQDQLVTVTQDPALQSYAETAGADARKKQEAMKAAEGRIAVERFRTIVMAVMPGAAMAGMASAHAQAQAQGAEAMNQAAERMQQMEKMMPLLPAIMRGQRVVELAVAKRCEWAESAVSAQ